jgi:hypothetical protein
MRTALSALLVGAVLLGGTSSARADSPLFHPTTRALAAADDEPPPHLDRRAAKKPEQPATPHEVVPVYKTWWFWALTAAVVGGTVVFGVATFKPAPHAPMACMPDSVACFGDGRPR